MLRIGVDVGGTNTDAALLHGDTVLATVKKATSADVTSGAVAAITTLLAQAGVEGSAVNALMIGTTHFLNALIERKGLEKTAVLRLCGPTSRAFPPMIDWPEDLRQAVTGGVALVAGGYEVDGRVISPLDAEEIRQYCAIWAAAGIRSVAICGVFSVANPEMELEAARIVTDALPGVAISLSHRIGQTGLLERESATILNACLSSLGSRTIQALRAAFAQVGLTCPLYLTQNDGTLMTAAYAEAFPIFSLASGPTNSMRGASFLTGLTDAIVVDIGGTTTDVGILVNGFPRARGEGAEIAGVRTNFRVPDVMSIGLGGGSLVRINGAEISVGPDSVGYQLTKLARVFGGTELTATDIAVAGGRCDLGDKAALGDLNPQTVAAALDMITANVARLVDQMKPGPEPVPVIVVGGGSVLLGQSLEGASDLLRPDHFGAANAIGAAIAQVSGEVDTIIAMEGRDRAAVLTEVTNQARTRAVEAGADAATLTVVDVVETPLAYLPGSATRIMVKVVGDIAP